MLTSTFTLVALAVEQTAVRAALHALAERMQALPDTPTLAHGRAVQLVNGLREVYDNCHWRKLDKFLVPALRRRGATFDVLLGELEALSCEAAKAMASAQACVDGGEGAERVERAGFCHAVECSLAALRCRLEREEQELFPLARNEVGGEAWFAIANQLLAHDAYKKERRGVGVHREPVVPDPLRTDGRRPAAQAIALSIAH